MSGHNQPAYELFLNGEAISITLNVLFETDKAVIKNNFYDDIKKVANFMAKNPTAIVNIEGHTDSRASTDYNQTLSEKRANAVRDELIKYGIDANRLIAIGYGELKPIATNSTAEGMAQNRRVVATSTSVNNLGIKIKDRLESLTLTDNRGLEADELELVLDDHDNALALPKRGAVIQLSLGWTDSALINKGTFIVDEVEHSGSPDKLSIKARSADFKDNIHAKKATSYHAKTLGEIVATIAKAHKLTPKVSKELASINIAHVDQTDESDLNLLSRLAKDYDAIVTVKSGHLMLFKAGQATTVSGKPIPPVTITREDGDQHRYTLVERESGYTGVKAYWNDKKGARRKEVLVGKDDKLKVIRKTYRSETEAKHAAQAELKRSQRNAATFSLTLALGRPEIIPETPAKLNGWKAEIDTHSWLVIKATHSLSGSGLTTGLEMETLVN